MTLTSQELDDLYTDLCYRMSRIGEVATPEVLARLCLLLIHEVGDSQRIRAAIDEATRGYPSIVDIESPV